MLEVEFDEKRTSILLNNSGTATNEKAQSKNVQLEEINKGRMDAMMMPAASKLAEIVESELDESLKPPVTIARGAPRVSPVSVMMIADVPVAAPAVVSTIEVLVAVAAGVEVAVNNVTPLAMEVTVPKK